MKLTFRVLLVPTIVVLVLTGSASALAKHVGHGHAGGSFLNSVNSSPSLTASSVATNGDANPYGVAVVPVGFPSGGAITSGDVLVSNFNNAAGHQGMGTTIVSVAPNGTASTFFTAPGSLGPVGLTTALVVLRSGIVVVGNTPTTDGTSATLSNGSLIFLDKSGNVLLNLQHSKLLQGPWNMTADDSSLHAPVLFVSNVLSGTITRVDLRVATKSGIPSVTVKSLTQIASGFLHRTDPAALVVGPTGLLLAGKGHGKGGHDSLYVADTGSDSIQLVQNAGQSKTHQGIGSTIVSGAPLEGPLALARTPIGTIIASNGDAAGPPQSLSNINRVVEIDPRRHAFVASLQLDTSGTAGAIFGIAVASVNGTPSLVYVNDNTNSVNVVATT